MKYSAFLFLIAFLSLQCRSVKPYESDQLRIIPLTANSFIHVSYLDAPGFGKVACNGLIYIDGGEAAIFDSPATVAVAEELILLVEGRWKQKIKAVVINHFHEDCLGGLSAFHEEGIPSYAHQQTIDLAGEQSATVPQHGFYDSLRLQVGGAEIFNFYPGPAHTQDNIVSYIAADQPLFGGCMVKSMNASKGFVGDADLGEWANTIRKVKLQFPEARLIVPGHGEHGGQELLDYTIDLFEAGN